ncbi:vitamin K epoxide reductase complex subunit 1-like protein 1 [Ciona intestinalis]
MLHLQHSCVQAILMNKLLAFRILVCVIGVILSIYAYYVEVAKTNDVSYEALCDFNDIVSCSAVFSSRYGKGFGLLEYLVGENHFLNQPNSLFGIGFFSIQMLGISPMNKTFNYILYILTGGGIVTSIYLACILIFVLKDFCVLCVSTYVLTIILHYLNYKLLHHNVNSHKKMH